MANVVQYGGLAGYTLPVLERMTYGEIGDLLVWLSEQKAREKKEMDALKAKTKTK